MLIISLNDCSILTPIHMTLLLEDGPFIAWPHLPLSSQHKVEKTGNFQALLTISLCVFWLTGCATTTTEWPWVSWNTYLWKCPLKRKAATSLSEVGEAARPNKARVPTDRRTSEFPSLSQIRLDLGLLFFSHLMTSQIHQQIRQPLGSVRLLLCSYCTTSQLRCMPQNSSKACHVVKEDQDLHVVL